MSVTTHSGGSILGHPVKRTEDRELITGAGVYTGNMPVQGALHAFFVRSPIAHGTLGDIYTPVNVEIAVRPSVYHPTLT